jgi:hypothetical protein
MGVNEGKMTDLAQVIEAIEHGLLKPKDKNDG